MKPRWLIFILIGCLAVFFARSGFAQELRDLRIGWIVQNPVQPHPEIQPLTQYLESQLGNVGIQKVEAVFTGSIHAMGFLLRRGKVDIFIDSPVTSLAVGELTPLKWMLQVSKGNEPVYRSVIFAKQESPVQKLSDLAGRVIALKDPQSSSGFWLPLLALKEQGLSPVFLNSLHQKVTPPQTGYFFSYENLDTLRWVEEGLVAAGAMDDVFFKDHTKEGEGYRVLYRSDPMPIQVVSYREDLPKHLVQETKNALLQMGQSPAEKKALEQMGLGTGFAELSGPPSEMIPHFAKLRAFIRQFLKINS